VNFKAVSRLFRYCFPLVTLSATLVLSGCNNSMSHTGKYVNEKQPQNFFELRKGGIFIIVQGDVSKTGKYVIDGNNVTITLDEGGAAQGKIEGKTFITTEEDDLHCSD
jgi:hypothetical protein